MEDFHVLPSRSPSETSSQSDIEMINLSDFTPNEPPLHDQPRGGNDDDGHDDDDDDDDDEQEDRSNSALLPHNDRTRGRERSPERLLELWPQIKSIVIEVSESQFSVTAVISTCLDCPHSLTYNNKLVIHRKTYGPGFGEH